MKLWISLLLVAVVVLPTGALALSAEAAQMSRAMLQQAMSSPSGKLTLSPEILIPDPRDPTAILLQGPAVTSLSTCIRTKAKANTAFVMAESLGSFRNFCKEQEEARGNFPGPVPAVYCAKDNTDVQGILEGMGEVAETGVSGILVAINEGSEISSLEDISGDAPWMTVCKAAMDCGMQPIPEVTLKDTTATTWKEEDIESLVDKLAEYMGEDPVSILITINSESNSDDDDDDDDDDESEELPEQLPLPAVRKALGKRVPILASVKMGAGGGRMGQETARIKDAGFTGAVLRRECVPGFPANPGVEFSSDFWSACIGDLKSTRSKTFNFRSKNNMEVSMGTKWANLQSDVMESGALGEMEDNVPPGFDADSGDYQGF